MNKTKVVVVGSSNLDHMVTLNTFPRLGETLLAEKLEYFPGGKGANQAVAAARLGAEVTFISALGDDEEGKILRQQLHKEGLDLHFCKECKGYPSGSAYVFATGGNNAIIVYSGANQQLQPADVEKAENAIKAADVILLQLEIPLVTAWKTCELAHSLGKTIILNPAPTPHVPQSIIEKISVITPNESELLTLVTDKEKKDHESIIELLFDQWQQKLIVTEGEKGVIYFQDEKMHRLPAHRVNSQDSTGAGDIFNGALAAFWPLGRLEAIHLANAAAALSTLEKGAQNSCPSRKALKQFLYESGLKQLNALL